MEKLSIEKCRDILERDGAKYTDEEIIKIRDRLYELKPSNALIARFKQIYQLKDIIPANHSQE